ncbi:uncharacterized protein BX663DRAFT_516256 [Cokeromyces recurvatus]|uniref:uncharacterized protein n=1 Tax=Cokeromyces recurvatus TaxID=90255 RepID=UPI00221F5B05|nr:uncharacterized protein BX663DRAFT_524695 [Cokeromyces recurvatus]XP_051381067.1 uncharacterized protein BX663DRAFT_516256 [Cokeromyces recurvatus]KAI7898588.1 hypothetical protein BX663DRAFT_524695 [Cokeromyces recurvatus]KAI7901082.1 hypothetical protein BX663DRAFT_516256 [Cokeromyces recurvatus]
MTNSTDNDIDRVTSPINYAHSIDSVNSTYNVKNNTLCYPSSESSPELVSHHSFSIHDTLSRDSFETETLCPPSDRSSLYNISSSLPEQVVIPSTIHNHTRRMHSYSSSPSILREQISISIPTNEKNNIPNRQDTINNQCRFIALKARPWLSPFYLAIVSCALLLISILYMIIYNISMLIIKKT